MIGKVLNTSATGCCPLGIMPQTSPLVQTSLPHSQLALLILPRVGEWESWGTVGAQE